MKKRLLVAVLLSSGVVLTFWSPAYAREEGKLGPFLTRLAETYEREGEPAAEALATARGLRPRRGRGGLLVPVIFEPLPGAGARSIDVLTVRALGGQVDAVSRSFMRVLASFGAMRNLAKHPDVRLVRAPTPVKPHYGPNESESVALTGAADLHAVGITGAETKVAVVDLGFIGLSNAIAAGELPSGTVAVDLPGTYDDNIESYTNHGVGVAEHVLDMAPGTELYCILVGDETDLENAATYIRDNGIQIANHSVGWVNSSYYDDTGPINSIINDSYDIDDVFWAVAVGNDAEYHWRGSWYDPDGDDILNFMDADELMEMTTASGTISIFLNWNQYGNSVTDLDLYVVDKNQSTVASSEGWQTGPEDPAEALSFKYVSGRAPYSIEVRWYSGPTDGLDMTIFSFYNKLEYPVAASSLMDPADAHGAFSAGAIDQADWELADPPSQPYSSQGPTTDGRLKPDIAAPDGTTSWTYGDQGSTGTSFSSPTVAGAAALLLDGNPSLAAGDIATRLSTGAIDIGDSGPDYVFGAGKLALTEGLTYVLMGARSVHSVGIGTLVKWTAESEVDNRGFDILRRPADGGRWKRLVSPPIPGRLTAVGPKTYRYLDTVKPGRYEYRIETIAADGRRERYGSRETMTVEVSRDDLGASLADVPGLLFDRAERAYSGWRARYVAAVRRRQLAAMGAGATRGAHAGKPAAGRRARRPEIRRLASTVGPGERAGHHQMGAGGARLSRGQVCVRTKGDGIFFVPAEMLPVAPERAVLIAGGVRSRPLEADASGIWFFAADYRDAYTDTNATFVTTGPRVARGSREHREPAGLFGRDCVVTMRATARAEENTRFAHGAAGAPGPWFYREFLTDGASEREVNLDIVDLTRDEALLRVAVYGYTKDDGVAPDHELVVSVNDEAVADLFWDGCGYEVFEIPLAEGAIREGVNTVGLLAPENPAIPNGHGAALDYVELEYSRRLSVTSGPLLFEFDGPAIVEIGGIVSPELWVVEIRGSGRASRIRAAFRKSGTACVAHFKTRDGCAYYVARPDQVRTPEYVSNAFIVNVPPRTDYLAVGPEVFRDSAQPLVEARGGVYLSLEAAIDTYGCGRYGAAAIANLAREARPRYLLLVGDNSYDYLDNEGKGVDPMVPAMLTATRYLCRANADALYGDLDGDGTPEIPVGRLPVRTEDELARLVAKILDHDARASDLSGCLVADDKDEGGDFPAAQDAIAQRYPEVDWTKLYSGIHGDNAFVRERLTRAVNSGSDLVIYQGHGTYRALAAEAPILDVAEAGRWVGSPVVYLSTCWGAYIHKNTESSMTIAETLLRSEGGGSAVIASTVLSGQLSQEALLNDFLEAALCEGLTIGEALVSAQRKAAARARNAAVESVRQDILDTMRCYVVLGDPAMPIVSDLADD